MKREHEWVRRARIFLMDNYQPPFWPDLAFDAKKLVDFERAVRVDGSDWPGGCVVVNGMSNNKGMVWSLEEARQWLGYEPVDDVYGT